LNNRINLHLGSKVGGQKWKNQKKKRKNNKPTNKKKKKRKKKKKPGP